MSSPRTPVTPATSRFSRPVHLALLVLLLYTGVTLNMLRSRSWDVTTFILAGDKFTQSIDVTAPIAILPNSAGYDGQFYYRLALDPFTSKITDFGITLDNPATRGARILYPFLAWLVSAGQPHAVPWVMLGLNLAGLFSITWMSTALARSHGLSTWFGLAPALYPGFLITIIRDTTEITAVTFAVAALSLALKRHFWRAAPLAACAVLTRETTLLYMAGFGLVEAFHSLRTKHWSRNLFALILPAAVFVAWHAVVIQHWGMSSYSGTEQNLGPPLEGLTAFFKTNAAPLRSALWRSRQFQLHAYYVLTAAMCLAASALAAKAALSSRSNPGLRISWLLYLSLVLCLTTAIWIEPYDYLRAFSDCFVVGSSLILLAGQPLTAAALLVLTVPIWCLTAFWFL